jgi:hypothetical protein
MAKLKVSTSDGVAIQFGPLKAAVENDSFSFKFKGFKAEGSVTKVEGSVDDFTIDGTLKLRGTKLDVDGVLDPIGPIYSFDGTVGKTSLAAEATVSPTDVFGFVEVNTQRFDFDLNL